MAFEVTYRETQEALVTYLVEADDSHQAELEAYEAGELLKVEQIKRVDCEVQSVFPASPNQPRGAVLWAAYTCPKKQTTPNNHRLFLLPALVTPEQLDIVDLVGQLDLDIDDGSKLYIAPVEQDEPIRIQF